MGSNKPLRSTRADFFREIAAFSKKQEFNANSARWLVDSEKKRMKKTHDSDRQNAEFVASCADAP